MKIDRNCHKNCFETFSSNIYSERQNTDGRLILTAEVTKNELAKTSKIWANFFKYILLVLAILFFVTSAVRISLPSVFCIWDILLIQVYKRSGTTHRFVAVVMQIFIVYIVNTIFGTHLLTSPLSVEPNPHRDMTVPREWMESDEFCVKRTTKLVRHVAVTVPVSWENLRWKGKGKEKEVSSLPS